ncbi:hypothetical protein ACH4U6_04395 [Streptomyces netropsis]|uniref:hypothetical protein n=1 Tax=Streptomyces netropsis TaxID=55404 RepID=UPI0037B328BF
MRRRTRPDRTGHRFPGRGVTVGVLQRFDQPSPHGGRTVRRGKRSLIVYDSGTTVRTAGVVDVHLSGRVTEGRSKGQTAQRDVLLALPRELPTECLSSGLPGNSGQAQLEIRP